LRKRLSAPKTERKQLEVIRKLLPHYKARSSPWSWLSQLDIWFQLVKIWLTILRTALSIV
jgi:hypothetical protein